MLILGGVAAYLWLPLVGSASPKALSWSVTRTVGGSFFANTPCTERRRGIWSCDVTDTAESGSWLYRVRTRGPCWEARVTAGGGEGRPLPRQARGCVRLRDQARLTNRLPDEEFLVMVAQN